MKGDLAHLAHDIGVVIGDESEAPGPASLLVVHDHGVLHLAEPVYKKKRGALCYELSRNWHRIFETSGTASTVFKSGQIIQFIRSHWPQIFQRE